MASYVDGTHLPNEIVIYRANISLWSLFSYLMLGVILVAVGMALIFLYWATIKESTTELSVSLFVVGVGLISLLWAYILYKTTEFAVTDKRIIAKTGLISRNTVEMFLDKVESLNVEQGVMGRLLDYGTVGIRGTGITEELIRNISNPLLLRKQFMTAADKYRGKV